VLQRIVLRDVAVEIFEIAFCARRDQNLMSHQPRAPRARTIVNVSGSVGCTPYRDPASSLVPASAANTPMARPGTTIHRLRHSTLVITLVIAA